MLQNSTDNHSMVQNSRQITYKDEQSGILKQKQKGRISLISLDETQFCVVRDARPDVETLVL